MTTQADLDALKAAYNQGVIEVTSKGRTVKYRSLAEMQTIISRMERDLGVTKTNTISFTTDRGYCR